MTNLTLKDIAKIAELGDATSEISKLKLTLYLINIAHNLANSAADAYSISADPIVQPICDARTSLITMIDNFSK